MVVLSVVVPTYNVRDYLPQCLDSILDQPPVVELEVVAVDDRSTDGCSAILDAYAARDPRVRVLHLPENVGLGGARNAGLAAARGDYVWFVDSDDWVDTQSLARIAERLERARPDVLVLGHAVVHEDGATERGPGDEVLADLPDVFTAAEAPDVFRIFPSAWTKVLRREFLAGLHMPFPPGHYEDLPVTIPALCAADVIAVVDDVCIFYRRRRGSILRSGGQQHFDVIGQYDLLFERLGELGRRAEPSLSPVYGFMVVHLFSLLGARRIESRLLQAFFRQASDLARRRRPAGFVSPPGLDGARYRLLVRGAWRPASVLRLGYRLSQAAAAGVSRVGPRGATRVRDLRDLGTKAALLAYYRMSTRRPLDEDLALYSAYWGDSYACNPRAIYEKALQLAPTVRGVWAIKPGHEGVLPDDVDRVILDTAAYYRHLARAKYLVNNANFGDHYVKRRGSVFVQTHHGTPLKSMGVDLPHATPSDTRRLLQRCRAWDYSLSSNRYSTEIWSRAYPVDVTTLEYGYPRNDVLVGATPERIAEVRVRLGLLPGETAILYMPTHRDDQAEYADQLDLSAFGSALGPSFRLLMRTHYFYADGTRCAALGPGVVDVSRHPRVEDLYLAADVLLTDYSSAMFDFGLLDRPIAIYAPDWDRYRELRGAYFDLEADAPGPFTRTFGELVEAIRGGAVDADAAREQRARFRARFCSFDDGRAAERVVRKVMLGEEPDTPTR